MTKEEVRNLSIGDVVQHITTLETYVVVSAEGPIPVVASALPITDPGKWRMVRKEG